VAAQRPINSGGASIWGKPGTAAAQGPETGHIKTDEKS